MLDQLARWIIINQHPFTVVEETNFISFIHSLNPNIKVPTADTIKNKIISFYETDKEKIKTILQDVPGKISFTTDCWTSPSFKSFLSLTAHFIDKEWVLQNIIIDFIQMLGSHAGSDIKDAFILGLENFSIENKVIIFLIFYFLILSISLYEFLIFHIYYYS